jgi:serine/threonine protein phosphatase PrpC
MRAAQDAVTRVPWKAARDRSAPSCTAVAAAWDGQAVSVCGVGDSRAYWVGATTAARLTVDDSWAQEQVDAGTMTEAEADGDVRAHQITRWLGVDAPEDPFVINRFVPPEAGRLVVCTDGCWNYAPGPEAFAATVRAHDEEPPLAVSRALVDHALAGGGHDNITVAVVDIVPPPDAVITGGEQ